MIIDSPIISGSHAASGSLNQHGDVVITGSLTVTGTINASITGSITSASYASYAETLDGLDSTSFVTTSSFNTVSGSFSTRVTNLESFSSSLDATFATDAELAAVSQSLSSSLSIVSGSLSSRVANNEATGSSLTTASGSFSTRVTNNEATGSSLVTASGSFSTRTTNLETASGSFSTRVTSAESSITSLNGVSGSYATTGSNNFNGNQVITGSLTTTGTIVAQTLNVQQVTSSIVYSSGSNIFGNSVSNTQQFTGSLQVSGSNHYILGNVGIGTTNPSYSLDSTGIINSNAFLPYLGFSTPVGRTYNYVTSYGSGDTINYSGTGTLGFQYNYFANNEFYTTAGGTSNLLIVGFRNQNYIRSAVSTVPFQMVAFNNRFEAHDANDLGTLGNLNTVNSSFNREATASPLGGVATAYHYTTQTRLRSGFYTATRWGNENLQVADTAGSQTSSITDYDFLLNTTNVGSTSGGPGTITNFYLLRHVTNIGATGTITNRWGLYLTDSTFKSYHAGNFLIGTNSETGNSKLQVSGSTYLNGDVGIGTSSDLARVTILADSSAQSIGLIGRSGDNISTIRWWNNAGNSVYTAIESNANYTIYNTVTNGYASFHTNNTERLRITSGGDVGVGTTSPLTRLDSRISSYTSSLSQPAFFGTSDATGPLGIVIQIISGSGNPLRTEITSTRYGVSGNDLTLNRDSDAGSGGLTIQYQGNVGVGTSSPVSPFEVRGTSGNGVPTFRITSTSANDSFNYAGAILNSSLGSSRNYALFIGKNLNTKNSGYIGFNHSGTDGSNSNFLNFGHFNNDYLLNILGNGNVGIGTTSPTELLHVNGGDIRVGDISAVTNFAGTSPYVGVGGNGTSALFIAHASGFGVGYFGYDAPNDRLIIACDNGGGANKIDFSVNAGATADGSTNNLNGISVAMRINASGNVGIGTTSPSSTYGTLTVAGTGITIADDGNAKLQIGRYSAGASNSYIKLGANSNSLRITNNTDTVDIFTIENGGNVGIGTTTPNFKLDTRGTGTILGLVSTDGTPTRLMIQRSTVPVYLTDMYTAATTAGASWSINKADTSAGSNSWAASVNTLYSTAAIRLNSDTSTSYITFLTANAVNTNPSESVRITGDGRVGIGTTAPSSKLDIASIASSDSTPGLIVSGSGWGSISNAMVRFDGGPSSDGNILLLRSSVNNRSDAEIFEVQNSGNNTCFVIKGNGNVGIGSSSPSGKLDIGGTLRVSDTLSWASGDGVNWYIQGQANGPTIRMKYHGGSADRSGALGWVDNAGGRYEALTWQDTTAWFSGNVGVGTTNPGYRLDINGTTTADLRIVDSGDVGFQMTSGGSSNAFSIRTNSSTVVMSTSNSRPLSIGVNSSSGDLLASTTGISIDSAGRLSSPNQPAFRAGRSTSYAPGSNTDIVFNSVFFNIGSHYNVSTGIFTAPVAGRYYFSSCVIWESVPDGQAMDDAFTIRWNGNITAYDFRRAEYVNGTTGNGGYYVTNANTLLNLAANDTVSIRNTYSLTVHGNQNFSWFVGYLIG